MNKTTRREFFKMAGGITLASALTGCSDATDRGFGGGGSNKGIDRIDLGMASYSLRKFNLEDTLAMTKRLGLKKIAFKSFHMPLESNRGKIKAIVEQVRGVGLNLYGCGVIYMKNEDEVHRAFDYAQAAEIKVMIGVPEHSLLELVDFKIKQFDIKLAIHNHGPGDERYPSPESIYEKVKDLDPRIGICMDIGHTARIGLDPSLELEKYADRIHDLHIKDVTDTTAEGKTVEMGRGIIDLPKFFRTLLEIDYQGVSSFEYEKDAEDPLPGLAESVGYVRGVLSVI